ncbi:hypothetical protein TMM008_59770 [Pseudomonas sp. 008]|nr:hypothetical protein TMM008_59770 [Pseudomonas sp. 008]
MGQLGANAAQTLEGFGAGIAQTNAGICEFKAASILDEQAHAEVFLQYLELPADCAMGDVQLFGSLTDAVQAGSGFEGAKRVQRGEVMAHLICEFS